MLHLLDQSPEQLQAWLAERGTPGYRAAQVRRWLFEKRAAAFEEMTDLAQDLRGQLAEAFVDLDHPGCSASEGRRRHREAALGTGRRRAHRVRALARRQAPPDDLHQHPGRLRDGLRLLRERTGRRRPQSHHRRNRRADAPLAAAARPGRAAQPHRRDGHGRAAGEPGSPAARPGDGHPARRPGDQRPADHDLDGGPAGGDSPTGPAGLPVPPGRLAARAGRRAAQRAGSVQPQGRASDRSWRRPTSTSRRPAGG